MKECDSSTPNTADIAHMGFLEVSVLNIWAGSGNNAFLSSKSLVCLIE